MNSKSKNLKQVPVYSINRFNKKQDKETQFQVEVFDKNRDFKVTYPHRHDDFFEILFITKGSGSYTIDFETYPLGPGKIFFLSPGQIHEINVSADIQGFIFLFTSAFYQLNSSNSFKLLELPYFFSLGGHTPMVVLNNDREADFLSFIFSKAIQEFEGNQIEKVAAVRAWLELLLIHLKRLYTIEGSEKLSNAKILVKRFKQLIEQKCQENLSVKQYAELLMVSPNHLSEVVKQVMGRTSSDLINDRMILEIKRLLVHTEMTISEISYQLHFSDQSYFTKYFKRLTTTSPLQFRKQKKST